MKKILKVGTRKSPLAMKQAELVISLLKEKNPEQEFEIVGISTEGDRDQKSLLSEIGGKGVFVKEVELRLLTGEIDFAVHSLKDLPAQLPERLTLAAHPKRAIPYDVLVFEGENPLKSDGEIRLGTGSARRSKQLSKAFPNLTLAPIRGKIETRLEKMKTENLDGIVLAAAGLQRMNYLEQLQYEVLPAELSIPAVGQGILAVECAMEDSELFNYLHSVSDEETEIAAIAERKFLELMNGNCDIPLAGFAQKNEENNWTFRAFLAKNQADEGKSVLLTGANPVHLAQQAFEQLIK